ncbi:MAG: hypothetical protein AAF823_02830 [Planctomycetota bacterium]
MPYSSNTGQQLFSQRPPEPEADLELLRFLLAWTDTPRAGSPPIDITPPTRAWREQLAKADDPALIGFAAEALMILRDRIGRR